jgi:SnoaL-like domain
MTNLDVSTVARFRAAVERRDPEALRELFAEEVLFYSPAKFRPFEGRTAVLAVFDVLLRRVFEEFRYVGELHGPVEDTAEAHVLIFRARVGGKDVHGMDLVQLDDAGLISQFTVMVRPLSGLTALSDAVAAGLEASSA